MTNPFDALEDPDVLDKIGRLGSEFIRDMLKRPSPLEGVLMPLPQVPFETVLVDDIVHWAGYAGTARRFTCVCTGLDVAETTRAPGVVTCIRCAVHQ